MGEYKPVTAGNFVGKESQLDRIERKMDRILELLESKETSISIDGKELADKLEIKIPEATLSKAIENKTINCGKLS